MQVLRTLPLGADVIAGFDVVLNHGLIVSSSEEGIKVEFGDAAKFGVGSEKHEVQSASAGSWSIGDE